jgi:preprotein translocase subunit SecG
VNIFAVIVLIVLVIDTIALIGLILIQRGKGGGLAGAFGGGGVEQAFGTRAATLAQKATAVLAGIYLLLSIVLGLTMGTVRPGAIATPRTEAPANTVPEKAPAPALPSPK